MAASKRRWWHEVRATLRIDDSADAILAPERELEVSLVDMATGGRVGLDPLVLGSVVSVSTGTLCHEPDPGEDHEAWPEQVPCEPGRQPGVAHQ